MSSDVDAEEVRRRARHVVTHLDDNEPDIAHNLCLTYTKDMNTEQKELFFFIIDYRSQRQK